MYFKKNFKSLVMLGIALAVILVSSFFGSMIQSRGWTIEVSDLRDETNSGQYYDATTGLAVEGVTVKGTVKSGILYAPKSASSSNKLPAVVLTHGYLNNREHQLPFAVELARRGFVVLTVDREGHGNYENEANTNAMMATNGLYDSVKYVYNLPYVDQTRIGISGHSMGGYTTASVLMSDMYNAANHAKGTGLGIVKAGLMQGWSTYMASGDMLGLDIDVGMFKARDDEFFFTSKDLQGNLTICRDYLHSVGAAGFVGLDTTGLTEINIKSGDVYVNGAPVQVNQGTAVGSPFRVVYESDEIHPLNHFSTESAGYVVDFFNNAFGTPTGAKYIKSTNQIWWLKEATATIGMAALFLLIFPIVSLLLTVPFFADLRKKEVVADQVVVENNSKKCPVLQLDPECEAKPLVGVQKHVSYWLGAVITTLFSGFSIHKMSSLGKEWFPNNSLYPQDTTNWVAMWAIVCGLFALLCILLFNIVNRVINHFRYRELAHEHNENPFECAKISSVSAMLKTLLLAFVVVASLYIVLFINWAIWKTDFRFWTFCVKVFDVPTMLPTMIRYMVFFGIFYSLNAIFNQTYRAKNLPEWATIAINAFFNVFGIALVMIIQYSTFRSTGVLWQPDMALGYIVLFPIVPVLIIATIISRLLYKKTGNIWLGAFVNTILFTVITVSGTAASFAYILA